MFDGEPHAPVRMIERLPGRLPLHRRERLGAERRRRLDEEHVGVARGQRGDLVVEVRRRRVVGLCGDDLQRGALDRRRQRLEEHMAEVVVVRHRRDRGELGMLGLQPRDPQERFGPVVAGPADGELVVLDVAPLRSAGGDEQVGHALVLGGVPDGADVRCAEDVGERGVRLGADGLVDVRLGLVRLVAVVLEVDDELVAVDAALAVDVVEVALHAVTDRAEPGERTRARQRHHEPDLGVGDALMGIPIRRAVLRVDREARTCRGTRRR